MILTLVRGERAFTGFFRWFPFWHVICKSAGRR